MRQKTALVAALGLSVLVIAGLVTQAGADRPDRREKLTLHVVERATTDTVTDLGPVGDSTGDLLTFANDVYDEANTEKVGRDQGDCIRINVELGSWECRWILFVKGGALTVEGPFYDAKDSVLIITGGRGIYAGAGGSMQLRLREGGTEFDFIYKIIV
jgi:allene oxide cyclase